MSKHRCEFCGRKVKIKKAYNYSYYTNQFIYYECEICNLYLSYKPDSNTIIQIRFHINEYTLDVDFIKERSKLFIKKQSELFINNYKPIYETNSIIAITPQDARTKVKTLLTFL